MSQHADTTGMDGTNLQLDLLSRVLDASSLRHRVIANNVANINTPNFQRLTVTFEDDLAKAVARGSSPATVRPQVVEDTSGAARVDGNTVDIDQEMGQLAKNSLLYAAAAQILASRIASMRSAISGR